MSVLALVAALAVQSSPLADPASPEAAAVMAPVNGIFSALAATESSATAAPTISI